MLLLLKLVLYYYCFVGLGCACLPEVPCRTMTHITSVSFYDITYRAHNIAIYLKKQCRYTYVELRVLYYTAGIFVSDCYLRVIFK